MKIKIKRQFVTETADEKMKQILSIIENAKTEQGHLRDRIEIENRMRMKERNE